MSANISRSEGDSDPSRMPETAPAAAPAGVQMSRRRMLAALGLAGAVAACSPTGPGSPTRFVRLRPANPAGPLPAGLDPSYADIYAGFEDGGFPIEPVNLSRMNPNFLRREVAFAGREAPGTIIVDIPARYLYLVLPGGRAMRYGVGVGREEAFNLKGKATVQRKAEWPRWIPTPEMIAREPKRYGPFKDGLDGGPRNPIGARALYLYQNGKDTYYRLHGTNEPYTIGTMVSSGCIRLMNQDIIDLYERVPVGATVDIRSQGIGRAA